MTERDFLTSSDPVAMAAVLPKEDCPQWRWFREAILRSGYDDGSRHGWSEKELLDVYNQNSMSPKAIESWLKKESEVDNMFRATQQQKTDFLLDIFGNPWKSYILCMEVLSYHHIDKFHANSRVVPGFRDWLSWNRGCIPALATRIHEERDFAAMPILADALEEAGCTEEPILRHLRNQPTVVTYSKDTTQICPWCGGKGYWRHGVHFEHMKQCGKCSKSWEPGETLRFREEIPHSGVHVRGCWALELFRKQEKP